MAPALCVGKPKPENTDHNFFDCVVVPKFMWSEVRDMFGVRLKSSSISVIFSSIYLSNVEFFCCCLRLGSIEYLEQVLDRGPFSSTA
jgi:hypothetical protein